MEGSHSYIPDPGNSSKLEPPAVEYSHQDGCSVIGGFVYRGTRSPALVGQYFFTDLCGAWLRSFTYSGGNVTSRTLWTSDVTFSTPLSFGEDARQELYLLASGSVYRIAQ